MNMDTALNDVDTVKHQLLDGCMLQPSVLCLQLLDYRLAVRSNSAELLQRLQAYFAHVLTPACDHAQAEVVAIERGIVDGGVAFVDWKREAGKAGRKDAIHDVPGGRLVRKVRTGMLFLQSEQALIAVGPCLEHANQVINFINSQFLNWLQQDGYLLCHAAALSVNGSGLAIAGLSGGGKSTLMLKLLENEAVSYVTNDRLLVRRQAQEVHAVGIPKLPRINPGTIVNNPRLFPLIDAATRARLLQLEQSELWRLEQKYDADINGLYGAGRIRHQTALHKFLVLNWRHEADQRVAINRVELSTRPDLLSAIMKPAGPFYLDSQGRFNQDDEHPDASAYLAALAGVEIFEASGTIDFERLASLCLERLLT